MEGKSSALKVSCTQKKNETTDKLIWHCVKRDDAVKCTAILQTSKNMDNPDMKKPHSHQPDENAITIAKCRHHEKKSQVNANAQLPDDAKAYIPSSDTCKRVL
jgi:hypothetical protein